ncbi:expressed unknown protein [Seminavis robusta]|uniref:DUF4886 domain-containing protein n=1 Tax=Seminavis robusta TaxID=568900 RepID=A0A9N8EYJ4_9STRA|nr:expressed unknown protein [Seminavis robusta]|eukprot:Sro2195_g318570.1 n/a (393) ;mRNA; f:14651-15829
MTGHSARCLGRLALLGLFSILPLVRAQGPSSLDLLMVGNSFSKAHNMEEMIQTMLNERKMILQTTSIFAARFEEGGANLTHYAYAPALKRMIHDRPWTWVVLQEQSETPGFNEMQSAWLGGFNASRKSVEILNREIQANGATTILFETWGYFDLDPYNSGYYPDYPTMQDKISRGYQIYYDDILKDNATAHVKIAPAGLAYQRIYNSIVDKGKDPHEKGSLFEELYMTVEDHPTPDNNVARKYPTLEGSYLCGCVLFQTLTGLDVRQSGYYPTGMDVKLAKILRDVAYDTVVEIEGTGDASGSAYDYGGTRPPYIPQDSGNSSTGGGSPAWRWMLAAVLMAGGLGSYWMAGKRQQRSMVPPSTRDYGWNPISHEDAMELTDVPNSGASMPLA